MFFRLKIPRHLTPPCLILILSILAVILTLLSACVSEEPSDSSFSNRPDSQDGQSVSQPTPESDGAMSPPSNLSGAAPTPTTSDIVKPQGYYHGARHGLALAQIGRLPSEDRRGWVDITLNLVAVKFDGGTINVRPGASNSLCFDVDDCFLVKWGSEEQFEAEMSVGTPDTATGESGSSGPKAANLVVAFQVAANATNANIYFGEHRIPLNLEGDYVLKGGHVDLLPAPEPPPTQDAKTANFFMDSEHGIAITGVFRGLNTNDSLLQIARVNLNVLSLGDYAPYTLEAGTDTSTGNICFGNAASECLEVFWGPEKQFNAFLTLEEGDEFVEARRGGARWPFSISVHFALPAKYDSALLVFGEHSIPLDLRGMTGDPDYDYTAHYTEATPGSVLYDSHGKTVILDEVRQIPASGAIELSMTARNDSEAVDFTPVFNPIGVFSRRGRVDVTEGTRVVTGETLGPGQSVSFNVVVPRSGNSEWGYVFYSPDSAKRPDGVVLQVTEKQGEGDESSGDALLGSLPGFVKFERTENEGDFWPVKLLWRHPNQLGEVVYADGVIVTEEGQRVVALDASTGQQLWQFGRSGQIVGVRIMDGVVYLYMGRSLYALNAVTGQQIWRFGLDHWRDPSPSDRIMLDDGIVYVTNIEGTTARSPRMLHALDVVTGQQVWEAIVPYNVFVTGGVLYWVNEGESLIASNPVTGEQIWTFDWDPWTLNRGHIRSYRFGYELRVAYIWINSNRGDLFAVEAATGKILWEQRGVRKGNYTTAEGIVYATYDEGPSFQDDETFLFAVEGVTGQLLWRYPGHYYEMTNYEMRSLQPLKVVDGLLYASGSSDPNDWLVALDAATGDLLWKTESPWPILSVHVKNGVAYTGSAYGLQAIDTNTGELLWDWLSPSREPDPTIGDEEIYVSVGSYLYALLAGDGE